MKQSKKWLGVLMAVVMVFTSVFVVALISSPTEASSSDGPLRVEIQANRGRYTLFGRMQFTATVANISDSTVNNIHAETLFGESLQPLANGSTFTSARTSLAPGESFSFTFNARLGELRGLDNLLLPIFWVSSMTHGRTADIQDSNFNDGRDFVQVSHSVGLISFFSGLYDASTTVRVWYNAPAGNGNNNGGTTTEPPTTQPDIEPDYSESISTSEYGWEYVDNQLLVHAVREVSRAEMETITERISTEIVEHMTFSNIFVIQFSSRKSVAELEDYITYLEALPQIRFVHINYVSEFDEANFEAFEPNDPWGSVPGFPIDWDVNFYNWGVRKISAPYAWAHRNQFQPITVGVIDSEIDFGHEDLYGWTVNPTGIAPQWHGTHVAGTIGATFNNGIGISGVAPNAELLGFNADRLREDARTHIRAFELLFDEGANVINFSRTTHGHALIFAASRGNTRARNFIYRYADAMSDYLSGILSIEHEFLLVTAAGNTNDMMFSSWDLRDFGFMSGGSGNINSRYTSFFNAITDDEVRSRILVVGSIGGYPNNIRQSAFSNRNPDIFAPGEMIFSTLPNNAYASWREGAPIVGTSMATPHVSGVATMVWGTDPSLRGDEVRNIILNNTTNLATDSSVNVVNARLAVEYAIYRTDGNTEPPPFSATPMVAAGINHTVALRSDGTVWAWGDNTSGQLGDGTRNANHTPIQVQGLSNIIAIDADFNHTIALRDDGTVWAFGSHWSANNNPAPTQIANLENITAISTGGSHALALQNDGTVWAWGNNTRGELGDGTVSTVNRIIPRQVLNLNNVTAISAGSSNSLALRNDGTVWHWGILVSSMQGSIESRLPTQVQTLYNITAISAGGMAAAALRSDGTVWAWGSTSWGALGDGSNSSPWARFPPGQVRNLNNATATHASPINQRMMAIRDDGTVWAWGFNQHGELGDGTTTNRNLPVQTQNLNNIIAVSAGQAQSIAVRDDGTVWSWGRNFEGQLGDGSTTDRHTPVQVVGPNGVGHLNLFVTP